MLLAFVADGAELTLLRLDHDLLHTCLQRARVALSSLNAGKNGWEVLEIVVGLSLLARLDFNKRLIVATGLVYASFLCLQIIIIIIIVIIIVVVIIIGFFLS